MGEGQDEKQEVGSVGWGRGEVKRWAPGSPTHGHPSQPPSGASGLAWGTEVGRGPADGPRLHSRVNVGYRQAESPGPREEEPRACLPMKLISGFPIFSPPILYGSLLDTPRVPKSALHSELTSSPT